MNDKNLGDLVSQALAQDMISGVNITFESTFQALLLTIVSTFIVRQIYIKYSRSLNNREHFANNFLLLGITICGVIIIIKYSLALSLGLVGALSIVRFRAAIKEPEELVYLFLVIALGIAFGANQFLVGSVILLFSVSVSLLTYRFFGRYTGSSNTSFIVSVTGSPEQIIKFRRTKLEQIANKGSVLFLKEMSIEKDNASLMIHASSDQMNDHLLISLEDYCSKNDLAMSFINHLTVPN